MPLMRDRWGPPARARAGGALASRRDVCRGITLGLALPLLGGCAAASLETGRSEAALLLPLTGPHATVGGNMARAASLVSAPGSHASLPVHDTGGTAEGARRAAERALAGGARTLLGPLRAEQVPEVVATAGTVPVVTFSNDDRLAELGAFVMGVTPAQSVAAAFSYARAQGIRRIALVARPSPLAEASAEAARRLAEAGGLTLTAVLSRDGPAGLVADLRAASGGRVPEAVFLPDGGPPLLAFAAALAGSGAQLLGGVQWGVVDVTGAPALEGAWFAAPSPELFLPFLDVFATRFGEEAGIIAALGHDAALMAAELSRAGALDRAGLTRPDGFVGVLGPFRFLPNGRSQRDLAVLSLEAGRLVALGEVAGT